MPEMKTFTVIAYILPEGGHHVETLDATDATEAALSIRTRLELSLEDFEVVAVAEGKVAWCEVDHARVNLAPFARTSP